MRFYLAALLTYCLVTMVNAQPNSAGHNHNPVVSSIMQTYSYRLLPGQDLKKEIEAIVRQEHIEAGAMLTCVGSLTDVTLRMANQSEPRVWHNHFEIVSLVGTLSTNGSHLHLSVSDLTGQTLGGHLLEGCTIYTTVELVIGVMTEVVYERQTDPTFGYKELIVRKKRRK
jgi:predicted DNA-binding protein with PD1-like motif